MAEHRQLEQDRKAAEYKVKTLEEKVKDYRQDLENEYQSEMAKLKSNKAGIVNALVEKGDYDGIKTNKEIQEIDEKINQINERIRTACKTYHDAEEKKERDSVLRCYGAIEKTHTSNYDKSRHAFKHRYQVVEPTKLGPLCNNITHTNVTGLKKLYKSYYEKICALESRSAINAFACGFCKRSLHVTANPAVDKNPSGKWILCRRCLGTPYCSEAHREAHRPVHEFSCAIHPGWKPPEPLDKTVIMRCSERLLQEPEMGIDFFKSEFGLDVAKTFKNCKEMMVQTATYLDAGNIKHHADCPCLGCMMRRGRIPDTASAGEHKEDTLSSLLKDKDAIEKLKEALKAAEAGQEPAPAVEEEEDGAIVRDDDDKSAEEPVA